MRSALGMLVWLLVLGCSDELGLSTAEAASANGRVALVALLGGSRHIRLVNPTGLGRAVTLDPAGGSAWNPAWSPDGSRLAFLSDRSGHQSLYVATVAGHVIHVGTPAGTDGQPAWSPDSRQIAFSSANAGDADVWVVNADGSGLTRVTSTGDAESSPSFSPDGTVIAYARNGAVHGVWTVRPNGSASAPVIASAGAVATPRWSPGGARLVFIGPGCPTGKSGVIVVNRDGSGLVRLGCGRLSSSHASFSTDGRMLILQQSGIVSGRYATQVSVTTLATRRLRVIARGAGEPVWAPDGMQIAMSDLGMSVSTARPSGLNRLRIVGPTGIRLQQPSWEPVPCTTTGTINADRLVGTPSRDVICGLGGADRVSASAGADVLSGGAGSDVLDLSALTAPATASLLRGALSGGVTTLSGFEQIMGTRFSDRLGGDQLPNTINGSYGNDVVIGNGGKDLLAGGYGNDVVDGRDGAGGDRVVGGPGSDVCYTDRGDTRAACAPPLSSLHLRSVPWLTLSQLSRCFFAPASSGWWPISPRLARHPVRSGFNDPRGGTLAHFGVDIEGRDRGAAYAINAGTITGSIKHGQVNEAFRIARYVYYHVTTPPGRGNGTYIVQGGFMGPTYPGMRHVHVSEVDPSCGLVDPRRPTGVLHDPANTNPPLIGSVSAYVANANAYRPFAYGRHVTPDPSTPLSLSFVHGIVDFRAVVADVPRHNTTFAPQQQMMVAGVRSYLAPVGHPYTTVSRVITPFIGATLIPPARYFQVMARPTRYIAICEYTHSQPCLIRLVLHVAGTGFDTRSVPNGDYQYCVSAVTIANHAGIHCTPVTIWNSARSRAAAGRTERPPLPLARVSPGTQQALRCLQAAPGSALAQRCELPDDGDGARG